MPADRGIPEALERKVEVCIAQGASRLNERKVSGDIREAHRFSARAEADITKLRRWAVNEYRAIGSGHT